MTGLRSVEERDLGRIDRALADGDGLAAHAEDLVAELVDELALGVRAERAVARVAHALLGLHAEPAVALDREVERLAGGAHGLRADVGDLLVDRGAAPSGPTTEPSVLLLSIRSPKERCDTRSAL